MKRWLLATLLAGSLTAQDYFERLIYTVDRNDTLKNLQERINAIDTIAPQVFSFNASGVVYGDIDKRIVALVKQHSKNLIPLVVNESFNKELVKQFLNDQKAQARFIDSLIRLAHEGSFNGWQLDFEHLGIESRESYSHFVKHLYQRLKKEKLILSIAIVPPRGEAKNQYNAKIFEEWISPYDVALLAKNSDFLTLMAYDQHTGATPPGPIASINWVEQIIKEVLLHAPKEKLSLGIPLYSRLWHAGVKDDKPRPLAKSLTFDGAQNYLGRHDLKPTWLEGDGVHWAIGEQGGVKEFLFLEDADSFRLKIELAKKYKLRGVSLWRLGQEDKNIWESLNVDSRKGRQ
ncbi:MAG: glycosyl hydrolase family 18 protein [Wolinella sp.]